MEYTTKDQCVDRPVSCSNVRGHEPLGYERFANYRLGSTAF